MCDETKGYEFVHHHVEADKVAIQSNALLLYKDGENIFAIMDMQSCLDSVIPVDVPTPGYMVTTFKELDFGPSTSRQANETDPGPISAMRIANHR